MIRTRGVPLIRKKLFSSTIPTFKSSDVSSIIPASRILIQHPLDVFFCKLYFRAEKASQSKLNLTHSTTVTWFVNVVQLSLTYHPDLAGNYLTSLLTNTEFARAGYGWVEMWWLASFLLRQFASSIHGPVSYPLRPEVTMATEHKYYPQVRSQ